MKIPETQEETQEMDIFAAKQFAGRPAAQGARASRAVGGQDPDAEKSDAARPSPLVVPTAAPEERPVAPPANRHGPGNALLAALSRRDYRRVEGLLEPVTLSFGQVLYEPGDAITHVYFPDLSLVSLLTMVDRHMALEVGLVGHEGMVGIPIALGVGVSATRAIVQGAGMATRMKSAHFLRELGRSAPLQRAVQRYTHILLAQVAQTAACNRFHVVEERLARWLLMSRDRVQKERIPMTQEFLSHMLGVRRVGVTKAAGQLQKRKLIEYSRGSIRIVDQQGLEAAACSCYRTIRDILA